MGTDRKAVTFDRVGSRILHLRDETVMLDVDLAELYGVETRELLQAVKRNLRRFPGDFMFQLSQSEFDALRSHFVISNEPRRGGRRYLPYAFTEQGIAMLSSVLRSARAIQVNIEVVRTFVRLRRVLATNAELVRKVNDLEQKFDGKFKVVFEALRELMDPKTKKRRPPIGFRPR
jgi:phage regulator Rha-like protein